jgi:hypothetical protein
MGFSRVIVLLALALMLVGFIILLHQFIVYGVWFELKDVHHETFAIASFTVALTLLLLSFSFRDEQLLRK